MVYTDRIKNKRYENALDIKGNLCLLLIKKTESKFKKKKGKFKSQCYPELVSGSKKQDILKDKKAIK